MISVIVNHLLERENKFIPAWNLDGILLSNQYAYDMAQSVSHIPILDCSY
uniref:Cl3036_1 n=1 Tax=Arundo donax TaxID=35708 RepID=A0A0A9CUA6_ARUDO